MTRHAGRDPVWGDSEQPLMTIARNLATRYVMIFADAAIGLFMLPFNVSHLGTEAYGLWLLTASIATYFSILDLGYGGALVKYVAQYRAWRDRTAINEIASTLFFLFGLVGIASYLVAIGVALNVQHVFALDPAQVATARVVLLIVSVQVAISFP